MEQEEQLILKPSIIKMLLILLLCFGFAISGIFLLRSNADFRIKLLGGYLNIVFFGGGSLFLLYKLLFRKPTLIISSYGVYPNCLLKDIKKWIPWQDIEKIGTSQQNIYARRISIYTGRPATTQKYLVIYLKNPQKYNFEKYISKETGERIATAFENSIRIKGDVYISDIMLPYSIDKVLLLFKKYPVKIDEVLDVM